MIVRLLLLALCWHESLSQVLTPSQVTISYHKPITATATCGEINGQPINELYCSLAGSSHYSPLNVYSYSEDNNNPSQYQEMRRERELFVQGGHGCGICRADAEDKSHPAVNMVDGNNSWWMSPPLSRGMQFNQINITIDLSQEFHVAYVWIQMANSPKPGTWSLERSVDYGKTWKPWYYFADSDAECMRRFGVESLAPIERDDQVICRSDLSSIHPLENGEIMLNLMEHRPSRESFMSSTSLQDFTRATNVRLRLLGTRTLQGHLMDLNEKTDPTVTRRYFYAIKEILMGGRCVCNGHASTCDIVDPRRPQTLVCRCEHNTCGDMCESCCPGFVAKKWEKTTATNNFTCEPCQCFGRSHECEYDESVVGSSLDIHGNKEGGGRCSNCRYNTEGVNCNQCVRGFFRPEGRDWADLQPCDQCRCDPSKHNGACAEGTGKCECLDRFIGENCDQCAPGYHSPPECLPCDCKAPGTQGDVCTPTNGTCPCNAGYGGDFCDRCADGFTNMTAGCKECGCDTTGSVHNKCDLVSGDCVCKAQFGGKKCTECAPGYFNFPECKYCDCDPSGTENGVCDGSSGQCLCKEGFAGRHCDQCDINYYGYPNCKPCGCEGTGALSTECDAKTGDCQCAANYTSRICDKCTAGYYGYPECKECSCLIDGAKGQTCDQNGQCFCKDNFHGIRCDSCKPNFYNFPLCEACNCNPNGVSHTFAGCDKVAPGELCECRANVQGRICNECKPTTWDLQYYHKDGCVDCACNLNGTISRLNTCKPQSGKCDCKRNVGGRACEKCAPGFYNLQSYHPHGCEPCNCDVGGALKGDCDATDGQCKCRPRVTGVRCDEPLQHHYFPTLWHHQYEAEDGYTPDNRGVRFAWDPEIFPNFSSRGFAVFSPIQETILINVDAPKATVSRILMKVHNPSSASMTAQVTLSRAIQTPGDTEQSTKVTFPPSESPYISEVTLSGKPFVISAGQWILKVETKQRLFWDFVVILPSQYYEGTNLVSNHNKACEAGVRDGEACLDLLYPPLPNVARADVTKEGLIPFDITDGEGQTVPLEMVPYELVREDIGPAAFVRADNISRIINAKIDVPEDGRYVILVEYHNREKTDLPLGMNVTQESTTHRGHCVIHYCPYSSFCRELITERGQPLVLPLQKGKAQISLAVEPNHEFGLSAVNLIKEEDWSIQYLKQVPVCVRRNGICEPLNYPPAAESVVVEAELGQREHRPITGDKLSFNVANPEELVVVPLDMTNPNLEVSGVVQGQNSYMIIVHYFNNDNTPIILDGLVSSKDNHFEAQIPLAYCPSVSGCRALVNEKGSPESFQFILDDKYTLQVLGKDLGGLKGPIMIDSITAVPYNHFTLNLLTPLPLDLSGDFIESCSDNFFLNDPKSNVSEACRGHIFSLTTEYNQAAFPCECSSQGSTSFDCEKYGGQCECRENIMGRRCDQCAPGYYGFPECKKCKCGKNQLCDSRTGQCSCPLHVEGTECDRCVVYAFGYDRLIGCQKCGCDPQGSEGGQAVCDAESGQCLCREHVGGRKCDSCLAGFYGFPHCHQCRCNKEGTTAQICDGTTAQCKCKENVVGRECEQCKAGTFALVATHDKGCIDCFCFGVTDRCQSSYAPVTLMTVDHSLVKTTDEKGKIEVDSSNYVVYTAEEERPKVVYWEIPVRKEKDYTMSYGLFMIVTLSSATHSDGHSREPDIVLTGGNYTGQFWSVEQPADPSLPFTIRMQITPDSLLHPSGLPMQRDEVMMLLHSLSSIRVKASFYTSTPTAQLMDFTLETADATATQEDLRALTVERCACPAPYTGPSCQHCADGYYRVKSGKYLGSCIPCNCHGHSGTCDKETGLCLECQHNTEGEHCETCIEGFYGDAESGSPYACSPCACPFAPENNFATSCDVTEEGITQSCKCKPGYAGERCETCAPGFFGDPEASGGSCEPCHCNGNNDLRDPQSCHSTYGSCHLCQNNTAGEHCETCNQWFYGDAITAKNCSSCSCDQCGSHYCSPQTGSCSCKQNVVGERCDRCAADHWGFSRCGGCAGCHCGIASSSSQCDGNNGQCPCRPGSTGLRCEQCEYGFWNYGEAGCTKCDCESDLAVGTVCDVHTGQCHCQEGATGARCDKCLPEYLRIPTMGCRKCDECVHHLKADVDSLDGDFARLSSSIANISAATIDGARLARSSKKMAVIQETFDLLNGLQSTEAGSLFSNITGGLEEAAVVRVHSDTTKKGSEENVKKMENLAKDLYTMSIDTKEGMTTSLRVVDSLRQLSYALEASAGKPKPIPQWIEESKEIVKKLEESSGRLNEMDGKKMTTGVEKARDAMAEVKEKEEKMKKTIEEKREREKQLKEYVDSALNLVMKSRAASDRATQKTKKMNVGKTEAMTKSIVEDAEKNTANIAKIAKLTKEVAAYAEQLAELGEDLKTIVASLNETMTTFESEKERRFKRDTEIPEGIDLSAINTKAHELEGQSANLKHQFESTKEASKGAVGAASVYDELSKKMKKAGEEAEKAKNVVEEEKGRVDALKTEIDEKSKGTNDVMAETEKTREAIKEVEKELKGVNEKKETVAREITNQRERMGRLGGGNPINETLQARIKEMAKMETTPADAEKMAETSAKVADLEKQAAAKVEGGMAGQLGLKQARANLKEINERREKGPVEWKRHADALRNATQRVDRLNEQLRKLKENLAMARDAVVKVSIPAHFEVGSFMDIKLSQQPYRSLVTLDLTIVFKTSHDGIPLYFGNVRNPRMAVPSTDDYMAVEVEQGRPVITFQLGDEPVRVALNTRITNGEWQRVDISRVGRSIKASLLTPDGKVVMETKTATSTGEHAVLNLQTATTKMYLGGIPIESQVNARGRSFVGDISEVILNGDSIGLWNVNENGIRNVVGANKRNSDESAFEREVGVSDGFLMFPLSFWNPRKNTKLSLSFLTYAPDGLLFYVGKDKKFMSIELDQGIVKVAMDLGSGVGTLQTEHTYNDGEWHSIRLTREEKQIQLNVDNETIPFEMKGDGVELAVGQYYYLGGVPLDVNTRSTVEPLRGCIRNVKLKDDVVNIRSAHRSKGVSASCPSVSLTREVSFLSDRSSAIFKNVSLGSIDQRIPFDLAFRFKTRQANTLICTVKNDDDETVLSVQLENGEVTIGGGGEGKEKGKIGSTVSDGSWHYVSIRRENNRVQVSLDDVYFSTMDNIEMEGESPMEKYSLVFGKQANDHYIGCIRDVTFGATVLEFAKSERREVRLTGCSMKEVAAGEVKVDDAMKEEEKKDGKLIDDEIEQPVTPSTTPITSTLAPQKQIDEIPIDGPVKEAFYPDTCALGNRHPADLTAGHRFGLVPTSKIGFNDFPESFDKGGVLSLMIRPDGAHGPIMYAADKKQGEFVSLYLKNGVVVMAFHTAASNKTVISSTTRVVDGKWHEVKVERKGNYAQLTVDDELVEGTLEKSADAVHFVAPVWFGGVPNNTLMANIGQDSLKQRMELMGCMKEIRFNGKSVGEPSEVDGVEECAAAREKGLYLGPKGGYAIIEHQQPLNTLITEILFRSRSTDGLIFSVGKVDYLELFLKEGQLHFNLKTSSGDTCTVSYTPSPKTSLCDGHWHHIRLYRRKKLLTMAVDGNSNMKICNDVKSIDFEFKDPFVFGKPAKNLVHENLTKHETFVGCIKVLDESTKAGQGKRKRDVDKYSLYETFDGITTYGDAQNKCPTS